MRYNENPQTLDECIHTIEVCTGIVAKYPGFAEQLKKGELNLGMFWDLNGASQGLANAYRRIDQLWSEARNKALEEAKAKPPQG